MACFILVIRRLAQEFSVKDNHTLIIEQEETSNTSLCIPLYSESLFCTICDILKEKLGVTHPIAILCFSF